MSKKLIPIVVLVVVAVIVVLLVGKKSPTPTDMPTDTTTLDGDNATTTAAKPVKRSTTKTPVVETPTNNPSEDEEPTEETPAPRKPVTIVTNIHVSDEKTELNVIEANKGDDIRLTFIADPRNNYHNGLEFRSDVMDPVRLLNGQSMMITFVADESFTFTPYWPGFTTPLPYKIDVVVK